MMKPASLFAIFIFGGLFGFGLTWSGMSKPEVVLTFLRFEDFGLVLVLGSAVLTTFLTFKLAPRIMGKPVLEDTFREHLNIDTVTTLKGSALFGVGWGISGVCPGPAFAGLGSGNWPLLLCLACMFAGAWCHGLLESRRQ